MEQYNQEWYGNKAMIKDMSCKIPQESLGWRIQ